MKIKMISLPFHWLYPTAPAKYVGCTVSVPFFDPFAPDRSAAFIRRVRQISFAAAVGSVPGKVFRVPRHPQCVYLPVERLTTIRLRTGSCERIVRQERGKGGFRLFRIADLMSMPFSAAPSAYVKRRTQTILERFS